MQHISMQSGTNRQFNFTLSVDGFLSINIHDQTQSTQHKRNEVRTRYSASGEAEVGGLGAQGQLKLPSRDYHTHHNNNNNK